MSIRDQQAINCKFHITLERIHEFLLEVGLLDLIAAGDFRRTLQRLSSNGFLTSLVVLAWIGCKFL